MWNLNHLLLQTNLNVLCVISYKMVLNKLRYFHFQTYS